MKTMLLFLSLAVLCMGCVNPTYHKTTVTDYFDEIGVKTKTVTEEEIKYEYSYFSSYKILGLEVKPYDPVTNTFSLRFLWGHMETAKVYKDQMYHSDFGFEDISLFTLQGTANHSFFIGGDMNTKDYIKMMTGSEKVE